MRSITYLATLAVLLGAEIVSAQCGGQNYIVIGAGVSGLAAARQLKSQNCPVVVLEARNRIGGRINTEVMGTTGGGTKVDMGASWIHGVGPGAGDLTQYNNMENPIFTIAKDNQISTVPTWLSDDD
jgi:monoamine oxidase